MVRVRVEIEGKRQEVEIEGNTVADLMKKLGLILDEYVPVLNGEVVTELEKLKDGDEVRFVRVWSGG